MRRPRSVSSPARRRGDARLSALEGVHPDVAFGGPPAAGEAEKAASPGRERSVQEGGQAINETVDESLVDGEVGGRAASSAALRVKGRGLADEPDHRGRDGLRIGLGRQIAADDPSPDATTGSRSPAMNAERRSLGLTLSQAKIPNTG